MIASSLWFSGCAQEPLYSGSVDLLALKEHTGIKVCVVGIDGASYKDLQQVAGSGEAPTLARILSAGSSAALCGVMEQSTAVGWCDALTGKDAAGHGITAILQKTEGNDPGGDSNIHSWNRPNGSLDRRCLAIWNILSAFEVDVGCVGLWATAPAEPVRGFLISDQWFLPLHSAIQEYRETGATSCPPGIEAKIAPLLFPPEKLPVAEMETLFPLTAEDREVLERTKKPLVGHGFTYLKYGFAMQRSIEESTLRLIEEAPPEVLILQLPALFQVALTFWHERDPELFGLRDTDSSVRRSQVFPGLLRHADRFLARLLERLEPDTLLLVLSTQEVGPATVTPVFVPVIHFGQYRSPGLAREMAAIGHSGRPEGTGFVIAAFGPAQPGERTTGNLVDLTPTLLGLLGLPIARDMQGRVLTELFDPKFFTSHPLRFIDTYETRVDRSSQFR